MKRFGKTSLMGWPLHQQTEDRAEPIRPAGVTSSWPFVPLVQREGNAPGYSGPGGRFLAGRYSNHAGSRDYKLYIPGSYSGQALPLIVMLHGCTQDPDDFAAGTRMNLVADDQQFFVLYPVQSESANKSRCWNWFNALHQRRNAGEPAIIADMTQQVVKQYNLDSAHVFIAGLSAGGAMAAIMGVTYPDLYAAVGIHSGLPYASARSLSAAISAMKNGARASKHGTAASVVLLSKRTPAPTIVFHGDRDTTVHPTNADQIVAQSVAMSNASKGWQPKAPLHARISQGRASNGHRYTQHTYRHENGQVVAEQWVIHGAGHAWSGGSRLGSYTDPKGPDATTEMLRFFLEAAS